MKATILYLIAASGFALTTRAESFRITAEFLYPNTAPRSSVNLPGLVVTPGTSTDAKYSSKDKLLDLTREHTVAAALTEVKDGGYELSFDYDEWTTSARTKDIRHISWHIKPTLQAGVDAVFPADALHPEKGVFRIKLEPVTL